MTKVVKFSITIEIEKGQRKEQFDIEAFVSNRERKRTGQIADLSYLLSALNKVGYRFLSDQPTGQHNQKVPMFW
ncbi:hypothetical protein ATC1_13684 [Flexilinea flocculi]|uniref:Uncharacterized protein n=1 Tax=Flexilinea flocculi TaxID=1678840 RepID=A0A0S7BTA9_9CHLR|nr:hypothetical protein ATC1_13684 [Flexilinea flocculi]